ncbi:MAG TPA: DUF3667 domain-containing protein [Caulobacterales bacterium]|nr:DUF3667 domain-containing protein [Caulobacterales bacterium]
MSGEIEAVGGAATAGLAAAVVEGGEARHAAEGPCANCGAELSGRYCHACGQAAHVHRSLLHMGEEVLHGIFHFDTKTWRTLPRLAFRPGTLTRDYIEGKRARYVSPLALFLFTIFLVFGVIAMVGNVSLNDIANVQVNGRDMRDPQARATTLAELQQQRAQAVADHHDEEVASLDNTIALVNAAGQKGGVLNQTLTQIEVNTGDAIRDAKITDRLRHPDLLMRQIEEAAYKFAFLLIPISLPFIALLFFWKRGVTLFDHAVFSLYSLSFMSLFFLIMGLVSPYAMSWMPTRVLRGILVLGVPPAHMFFQLGGAYKLGVFSALWRTAALLTICGVAFLVFIAFIVAVGLLG